ncbi:Ladderlectin [Amphibalanus amphitrite]|uniref:Ladderlectin n=1 Tax=Amphibalanus amphitrite TaxID=1232801 RepID=A0A6A4WCM8_AMPAM|nr:brevican core protein-like [Amphibalanus amphitrite]KAF0303753.1 Ladderlectin [Amphibalanus amphitrite]
MVRPGAVLLLLLVTSAAAVRYRWLDPVSLHGPAVQTVSAVSAVDCGRRCDAQTPQECSGFMYGPEDGMCRLFSGDCRGPAVNKSKQTSNHYMARNQCPGTMSNRCACPAGFSRCAGRCLKRLDLAVAYTEAESQCNALGAHLAVPRSDEENRCAIIAAGGTTVWLGLTDVVTEGQFVGADGCGTVPSTGPLWGTGQPNNANGNQPYVVLGLMEAGVWYSEWNDYWGDESINPLCQLAVCYRPDCQ